MFEVQIKNALKNAGLDESLWTQIKAEKEEQIENAVIDFIAARNLQSEVDKRVTQALKTQETKLKKEFDEKLAEATGKKIEKEKDTKTVETMTPEQKEIVELRDTVKALKETIEGVTTKITQSDMSSRICAELKKQGLSEKFEANITVTDPEKIAEAVTGFKNTYTEQQQAAIDAKLAAGELSAVKSGSAGQSLEASNIATYAASKGVGGAVKNPDFPGKISSPETGKTETAKE